jgi:hypothetical protein
MGSLTPDHPSLPGETVVWTGHPNLRASSARRAAPLFLLLCGMAVAMAMVSGDGLFGAIVLLVWLPGSAATVAVWAWQRSRTTYVLTDRCLHTTAPRRRSTIRLTSLPELQVVDEGDGCGTITTPEDPRRAGGPVLRWLGMSEGAILWSIPDPRGVRRRIEALRDDPVANTTPMSMTPIPAPPARRGRRGSNTLLGLTWMALGAVMLVFSGPAIAAFAWGALFMPIALIGTGAAFVVIPRVEARRGAVRGSGQLGIATVTAIREGPSSNETREQLFELEYRYEVAGRLHTGIVDRLGFDDAHLAGIGDPILIRYEAAKPQRSVWARG